MKIFLRLLLMALTLPSFCLADFSKWFTDKTMRIDYFHTGKKDQEIFSLDQVYVKGVWAGNKINLIDTLNLGEYQVKILDQQTSQLIYSRGFSTIFGEWKTTPEAVSIFKTFHETVLIPLPLKPIFLVIAKRDKGGRFQDLWQGTVINPGSRFVNQEETRLPEVKVIDLQVSGPCSTKVDLLILGDGYTGKEMKKFLKDARFFTSSLFKTSPFNKRQADFNVRALQTPSLDSGIDEPREKIWKNTLFNCSFNSLDLARYVLTTGNKELRNLAAAAPYDQIVLIFNSNRYGGGGIYNLYAIAFSSNADSEDRWLAEYVGTHEFGHAFAGLADEYYSSAVSYEEFYPLSVEPWEANITVLRNPNQLKWKALVEANTPIPTPWRKSEYDSLVLERSRLSDFTPEDRQRRDALDRQIMELVQSEKYYHKIGAFEGAGYTSKGIYRPFLDCRMFSKSLVDFDPVCQAAIERVIDFYTR